MSIDLKITLNPMETAIFDILLSSLKVKNRKTIARVAGGWVRDKLLNRESDDIDIALDDQSGVEFAEATNEYLKSMGETVRTMAVIQINPEQSKHLETANIKVLGLEIDCVNLRAETYTEESRIPEIRFGTAEEDALRRDFTINALFFNLNTQMIEDFTGKGIEDLEKGIIRTPIPASITFKDDPLRVLRAIRFASRYNFRLDKDLINAAIDPAIRLSLVHKVSRERVLKELSGMYNSKGIPFLSMYLLYKLHLFDSLIVFPEAKDIIIKVQEDQNHFFQFQTSDEIISKWKVISMATLTWINILSAIEMNNLWTHLQTSPLISKTMLLSVKGNDDLAKLNFASLVVCFRQISVMDKKGKVLQGIPTLLRDSLKLDSDTTKIVHILVDSLPLIALYSNTHQNSSVIMQTREEAGLIIRQCREQWTLAIYLACAFELAIHGSSLDPSVYFTIDNDNNNFDYDEFLSVPDISLSEEDIKIILRYRNLELLWRELQLADVYNMKPLIDGYELVKILPGLSKGPMVGKFIDAQIRWQLRNPDGTHEALLDYLKELHSLM